jgi:hypothetical protein
MLLLIFLAAHLALLPRTLEDLDSINFALGVRHFDVARHQPHPPGYPVFIAIAKLSTRALRAAGVDAAAPRGLAIWSAIAGTATLPALLILFRSLERRNRVAWWATVVTGASPLFWSTALRPLSDMTGLAFAVAAQALAVSALRPLPPSGGDSGSISQISGTTGLSPGRALVLASLVAGAAIGVRSQTAILTVPLLLYVLTTAGNRVSGRTRVTAVGAFVLGVLWWAVPLLIASGGPSGYLTALHTQAGEDFSGVVMLWTHRTARVAASAVLNTFVWPWGWWLGLVVCALGIIGAARILWRAPRSLLVLVIAFGPYAIFHLLFHETETVRYALPLLPAVAYAAMAAIELARSRLVLAGGSAAIAVASLVVAVPASAVYAHDGAPVFRLFDDMAATAHGGDPVDTIAMHAVARRAEEWSAPILPARVAKAPHGREWLTLIGLWRAEPSARVWFVADSKRTDLALFDPQSRDLARSYRWGFPEPPIVGGARPDNVDWYRLRPPSWMLGQGWSVTAEVGGVTARDHLGPHLAPAVAWLRRRSQDVTVLLGGRVLGTGPVSLHLTVNGTGIETWTLQPGFFMNRANIPAATLGSTADYVPLEVSAESPSRVPVSLEQFDAQRPGVPMFGYAEGWNEPEYNPSLGRAWRWASERSVLWVRPIGRAVTLRIAGESPLRYYDAAPTVRFLIGDRQVATIQPSSDFDQSISLPPDLLAAADGRVVLECSRSFVPGRGGDQRHLSLRIYRVAVDP